MGGGNTPTKQTEDRIIRIAKEDVPVRKPILETLRVYRKMGAEFFSACLQFTEGDSVFRS